MQKLTDSEIEKLYDLIVEKYEKYLKQFSVKMPNLRNANGDWTRDALVLVKLAEGYPKTKQISKKDLTAFVNLYFPGTNDVQQARHLSAQKGFNILSGTRGNAGLPKHSYWLKNLEMPYSGFSGDRRRGFAGDFAELKRLYNFRCATCGSKEGEESFVRKGVIVELQKGHMNNAEPLAEGNIIPQCQICNRADRNRWIYDKTGRVIGVAVTQDGFRAVMDFLKRATAKMRTDVLAYLQRK